MGGLNIQGFVGKNVGDASSFARGAVTGQFTPHQMVSAIVALEEEGSESARGLADLLAKVREGQFTTSQALANAERTIAALARNAKLFEDDAVVVARLEETLARRDASNPYYSPELGMCLSPDQLFTKDRTDSGAPASVGVAGFSEPPVANRKNRSGYRLDIAWNEEGVDPVLTERNGGSKVRVVTEKDHMISLLARAYPQNKYIIVEKPDGSVTIRVGEAGAKFENMGYEGERVLEFGIFDVEKVVRYGRMGLILDLRLGSSRDHASRIVSILRRVLKDDALRLADVQSHSIYGKQEGYTSTVVIIR